MTVLRSAWFLARKDVAYTIRQKETILWVFVMPILFFFFIGTVTGGFGGSGGSDDGPDPLALEAPAEPGFLADELVRRLEREGFDVRRPEDPAALEDDARRLRVSAPESERPFTAAVLAGEQQTLRLRSGGEGPDAAFDRFRVARAVYGVLADLVVAASRDEEPSPELFRRLEEMPRALTLDVRPAGARRHVPTGYEQTIPGTLVMFTMLVLLTSGSIFLVIEREQGLLRRLAATPIPRGSVVLGKWTGKMALALVQIGFAMLAGTLFFGMRWGTALPMVCLVLVAWGGFNASLGILLGNLARSEAQMAGLGVLASLALAALGGCWWPIEITPPWMQGLARCLPTGWAMEAMHRLISFGHGPASALPHFLALAAGALVLGWGAARTFRYQ